MVAALALSDATAALPISQMQYRYDAQGWRVARRRIAAEIQNHVGPTPADKAPAQPERQ